MGAAPAVMVAMPVTTQAQNPRRDLGETRYSRLAVTVHAQDQVIIRRVNATALGPGRWGWGTGAELEVQQIERVDDATEEAVVVHVRGVQTGWLWCTLHELIVQDEKRVFTFSMHGASNYPMFKEKSDLDLPLADHTDDETYLKLLDHHLKEVFYSFEPDFIFFQSGVDVLATDKLGRLGMTIEGCKRRDEMVLQLASANRVPLVASMGGGYSQKISHIVEAHANTYRLAQEIYF